MYSELGTLSSGCIYTLGNLDGKEICNTISLMLFINSVSAFFRKGILWSFFVWLVGFCFVGFFWLGFFLLVYVCAFEFFYLFGFFFFWNGIAFM